MIYPIDFFNELVVSDRLAILTYALKAMRTEKVSAFSSDKELKAHLWLIEQVEHVLGEEDPATGYACDFSHCNNPAKYYNSDGDAFWCEEHN